MSEATPRIDGVPLSQRGQARAQARSGASTMQIKPRAGYGGPPEGFNLPSSYRDARLPRSGDVRSALHLENNFTDYNLDGYA
jgi:hypothetical protein